MPEVLISYAPMLPELILAIGAMALLMFGVFRDETQENAELVGWLAIVVLIAAAVVLVTEGEGTNRLFNGAFIDDPFARFMKLLTLGGAAVALLLAFDDFRARNLLRFEYAILVLLSTVGMMLMISAGDLIAL